MQTLTSLLLIPAGATANRFRRPHLSAPLCMFRRGGCTASGVDGFPGAGLGGVDAGVGTVRVPAIGSKDTRTPRADLGLALPCSCCGFPRYPWLMRQQHALHGVAPGAAWTSTSRTNGAARSLVVTVQWLHLLGGGCGGDAPSMVSLPTNCDASHH
jgi:hypothetical protein